MRLLLVVLTMALLVASCQQPRATPAPPAGALSPAAALEAEGHMLAEQGDYAGAVEKYRQGIELGGSTVPLHFALGAAYSHLDRRPEAITQFRWVMEQADSGSAEYGTARAWLIRVGALVKPAGKDEPAGAEPAFEGLPKGRILGRTEWPGVEPRKHFVSGTLSIIRDEPASQEVTRTRAFRLGDAYEFRDVPPGRYRIVAVVDETTLWDQKVTVEPGQQTELVLSQSGSPVPVEKFAPPPAKPDVGQ